MSQLPPDAPQAWLARLAQQSAATWHALGARTFPGEMSVETANGIYRFLNGVFLSRARRPRTSFDAPKEMRGMRLIGFFADEGGFWSLSPRFRPGAHAVLWKPATTDARSFVLTSALVSIAREEASGVQSRPAPARAPAPAPALAPLGARAFVRPPSIRTLEPPSMTRLHSSACALARNLP